MKHKIDEVKATRDALFYHAVRFVYEMGAFGEVSIKLRNVCNEARCGGEYKTWSVFNGGHCWDRKAKKFVMDLSPDNRNEDYTRRTEYPLDVAVDELMYIRHTVINKTEDMKDKNDTREIVRLIQNELY